MLCLRQQIGSDPLRNVTPIGDDENLRRSGDHVDANTAEDAPLGCGDVGISRADDLVYGRNRRGAVGERRHRLRSAHPVHFVDPDHLSRGEDERIEDSARRRNGHHQPLDSGYLGGNGVHQHRGWIGGGAAGDIKSSCRDRSPPGGEPHPERIDIIDRQRQLLAMKVFDPLRGHL
jgi:hypothetical protein